MKIEKLNWCLKKIEGFSISIDISGMYSYDNPIPKLYVITRANFCKRRNNSALCASKSIPCKTLTQEVVDHLTIQVLDKTYERYVEYRAELGKTDQLDYPVIKSHT